jgi:fibronectin type 3 domain-containing protein
MRLSDCRDEVEVSERSRESCGSSESKRGDGTAYARFSRMWCKNELRHSFQTMAGVIVAMLCSIASSSSGATVSLAWDPNGEPDVTGYRVHRGSSPGVYSQSIDVGKTTTATLNDLTPGATYYMATTAYNSAGLESLPSNEVVYTAPAAPNQPPSVNLTGPANGSQFPAPANVTVSATAADVDGSIARVEFYSGSTKLGEDTSSPYTFNWSGLGAGSYTVKAVAFDNLGASTQSASNSFVVNVAMPGVVSSLNAAAVSTSQINLNWTAASGASSYVVRRSTTSGFSYTTVASGVTATSFNDTGLAANTTYYYVVNAVNSSGQSANSPEANATTQSVSPPAPPSSLAAAVSSPNSVTLNWSSATGATSYRVKRSTASGGPYTTVGTGVSATTYIDSGLATGATYFYVVTAVNAGGESGNSNQASITLTGGGLPSPWTNVDVGAVGASGTATYSNGTFTIDGSGENIGNRSDEFHYVRQTASRDCSIIVRVASVENTNSAARAGIMIRETTAAGSRYAGVFVTPKSGVMFQRRTSTGGRTSSNSVSGVTAPRWLRLTRTGSTFRAYYSSNGVNWTQFGGNRSFTMTSNLTIGLVVSSRLDGTVCTSTFDSVTVSP